MPADQETNSDDNPPGPKRSPSDHENRVAVVNQRNRAGVLTPLLKSLGWEFVGVGAQFEIESDESRKPTGQMRNLFGRQVATLSHVGSSLTASALRS